MNRLLLALFLLMLCPATGRAAPMPGQQVIGPNDVLRGEFTEEHSAKNLQEPLISSGHFTIAPAVGLIWALDKPFPTASVVTPHGMVQLLGNMPVAQMQAAQMPYLLRLYRELCGALAGDWRVLENDFIVNPVTLPNGHWQLQMQPLRPDKAMPFQTIIITGSRFVETVVMTKPDGNSERLTFINPSVTPMPPALPEQTSFSLVPR